MEGRTLALGSAVAGVMLILAGVLGYLLTLANPAGPSTVALAERPDVQVAVFFLVLIDIGGAMLILSSIVRKRTGARLLGP